VTSSTLLLFASGDDGGELPMRGGGTNVGPPIVARLFGVRPGVLPASAVRGTFSESIFMRSTDCAMLKRGERRTDWSFVGICDVDMA
jgi:hypothetical protein